MDDKKKKAIILATISGIIIIFITLISTNMFKERKIKKSDFIKATKECPYSYEEKDGKCIKTTVSEVGYECKTGTLSGNTCITIDTKDLVKSCPKGSKVQNDKCITEQNTTCPNNEKLINSDCYTTTEVKTECATNQELYKNKCYVLINSTDPDITSNPNDYEEIETNKYIKKNTGTNPTKSCDTSDFTYNNTLNLCVKKSNSNKVCSTGYTLENNKCIKYSNTILTCPIGYEKNEDKCEKKTTSKAEKITNENNKCPKNYDYKDNQCIKTQIKDYIYSCPNGFKLKEDKCYKI